MYPISMWPPDPKPTGCPCQAASLVCRQQLLRGGLSEQGRAARHKRCLLEAQASRKRELRNGKQLKEERKRFIVSIAAISMLGIGMEPARPEMSLL